jgi:hypothetical protein
MNQWRMVMTGKSVNPYDIWKAKADLVDFYRQDYERLQGLNRLLLACLAFSLSVTIILTGYLCKYL